jgi:hypothetical protein
MASLFLALFKSIQLLTEMQKTALIASMPESFLKVAQSTMAALELQSAQSAAAVAAAAAAKTPGPNPP